MYGRKQANGPGVLVGCLITLLILGLMGIAGFEFFQIKHYKDTADAANGNVSVARSQVADIKQQNENLRRELTTVQAETQAQTQTRILQEVAALYNVPGNETPSLVQIQDKSKLEGQEFFKNAENADYIIIYQKAKLSIIYRSSEHRIITTGPIEVRN
jgi:hypothetical protein